MHTPCHPQVLDVLTNLCERVRPPGALLERDDRYPTSEDLAAELAVIRTVINGTTARNE